MQYIGLSYTLQDHNAATSTLSTVAIGDRSAELRILGRRRGRRHLGLPRRRASTPNHKDDRIFARRRRHVVVDETPPYTPSATPSRSPDYAGGGGWYKDSVEVVLLLQRRPEPLGRLAGQRRQAVVAHRRRDVQHERLAHGLRDRRRQRRQRLAPGLRDGAGRCDAAEPRNHLPRECPGGRTGRRRRP